MSSPEVALLRAYPRLRKRIPHRPFLVGPTPVGSCPLAGVPEGVLFVKHDELSCPLYGGNKPRKLEFLIGRALARGSRRLITSGGLGTNHGLATAILGREAGLATTLVLVRQPVTRDVRQKLLLFGAYGVELRYGGNTPGAGAQSLWPFLASALRGERPTLVLPGGSSAVGNLGFVSAGLELGEQVRDGLVPAPSQVYLPVGTGGTLAGLAVGLRLAGLSARPVGVLVTDRMPPSPARLARAANATARALRRLDPSVPAVHVSTADFDLVREQLGPGYGAATPAARAAVEAARAVGLELETTYTGKCLAEILARAKRRELGRAPVLFWNTYSGVEGVAGAPRPLDPERIPRRLRPFLEVGLSSGDGSGR